MIAQNNIIHSWNLVYSIGNSIFNAIPPNYKIEELEDPIIIEFTALENINVWDYILIDQKDLTAKKWFWEKIFRGMKKKFSNRLNKRIAYTLFPITFGHSLNKFLGKRL
mgnify:CR=1 FL=1